MGFPQLLAANRSLRNIRNGPSRYKMTQANLLPRFGAESEPVLTSRSSVPVAGLPVSRPAKARGARGAQALVASAPAPAPSFQPRLGQASGQPWWRRWVRPFGGAGGPARSGPVQPELMLGTVEPVRNPLGENELNVFSAPGSAVSESTPGQAGAGQRAPIWRRWVGRFLGRDDGANRA